MADIPASASETANQPTVTLYWLEQSRSQRILWLLIALNIPYTIEIFHRDPNTKLAPPELKKVHALGKSPVISIQPADGSAPIVIAESGLITEYLAEHFGEGSTILPKHWKDGQENKVGGETEEWLRYKYYMHYSEGSLMPYLIVELIAGRVKSSPVPFFIRPITSMIASKISSSFLEPNFKTHFTFLEDQLKTSPGEGKYLCGKNLTAADILMSFPLIAAKSRGGFLTEENYPLLAKYIDALEQEEGYKKAVDRIVELEGTFSAVL